MTSNRKKASAIRKRKSSPNKANLKTDMKRTQKSREILRELAAKEQA
jgi:hypothetical protein